MSFMTIREGKASIHGYEHHDHLRILAQSAVAVVVKVPGHTYAIGSRHSMLGRGYAPVETKVYRIKRAVDEETLEVEQLISW